MPNTEQIVLAKDRLFELRKYFYYQCENNGPFYCALKYNPFHRLVLVDLYLNHLVFLNIKDSIFWVFSFPDNEINHWSLSLFTTKVNINLSPLNKKRLETLIYDFHKELPNEPSNIKIFLGEVNDTFLFYSYPLGIPTLSNLEAVIYIYYYKAYKFNSIGYEMCHERHTFIQKRARA